jgi:hypothetical protein
VPRGPFAFARPPEHPGWLLGYVLSQGRLGWNDVAIAKALDTYSVTVGNWRKRNNLQVNNEVHRKMLRTRDFNRAILEDVDAARAGKIRDPESLYFDTKFLEKFMGRKIAEA